MFPSAWLEQLAVGGVLVGCLVTELTTATPLYRLVKREDGSVDGAFLPMPSFFMVLREDEQGVEPAWDDTFYASLPMVEQDETELDLLTLLRDISFDLFVKQHLPGLQAHMHIQRPPGSTPIVQEICICLPDHAMLLCTPCSSKDQSWYIEARGSVPLWSRLVEIHRMWVEQGRPEVARYHIAIENGDYRIQLSGKD